MTEQNGHSKFRSQITSRRDEIAGVDYAIVHVDADNIGSFEAEFPEWPKQKEPLYVLSIMVEAILAAVQLETVKYSQEVAESGDVSKWPGGYFLAWGRTMAKETYGATSDDAVNAIGTAFFEGVLFGYLWRQIAPEFPGSELFLPDIKTD